MNSEKVATVGCIEAENTCGKIMMQQQYLGSSLSVREDEDAVATLSLISLRIESSQMVAHQHVNVT